MKSINQKWSLIKKSGFLTILILVVAISGFSQDSGYNIASQSSLVTEFDVNGLKVLVKRRPNSQTVSAGLFYRGGARNLTPQTAGLESLMLNVSTEGSKKYPREILRRETARTGSSIGSSAGADFSVLGLATPLQNFDTSWDMFTDIAINPNFAAEDVKLTKEKVLTILRNQEDAPDGYLQVLINKTLNAKTSYENEPDGTPENISRFTAEDLRNYHKKVMQTSHLLLVVVGDLDPAVLKQRIEASFGKLPKGDYKDPAFIPFDFSKSTLDITSRNLPTNYVQGVFDAPSINNPDYFAMRVAMSILHQLVYQEVRVKRNLSYAPSADMGNLAGNTANIYVTAVDANQSISVMLEQIEFLRTRLLREDIISSVAGSFLTSYYLEQETNAAQIRELARYELIGGGWRNSFEFLNHVKEVTPQDVQRVSAKYMKNIRFIVLGKPEYINRQIFLGQS